MEVAKIHCRCPDCDSRRETFKTAGLVVKDSSSIINGVELLTEQEQKITKSMEITDASFDAVVSKNLLVVVDFWAPWCAPCKKIEPLIDDLSRDLSDHVLFAKLNVDKDPRVPMRFHVRSIPTLIMFKRGKPVDKIVGSVSKATLLKKVKDSFK